MPKKKPLNRKLCNWKKSKHVALDMDGTIYLGDTLFPYTIDFLDKLKRMGISYSFLTNNPSKSIEDYLKKLARMGIHATEEEIYNTTVATIDYIKAHYPRRGASSSWARPA